ncbi:MAG: hypothetical protein IPG90_11965 [Bacteroidetes bacterium]|nr:hypothetical protein [Bacteroidota bacterium]
MSTLYQNKYRNESIRLQHWDYANAGAYFITICTKNRAHFFGEIIDGEMHLNEIGKIAKQEWIKTPDIRPDMNLKLGEFVVMPNHFHAVLIIGENQYNQQNDFTQFHVIGGDAMHCVPTNHMKLCGAPQNKFGPQSKNLASVIRGYKSSVTTRVKKMMAANLNTQNTIGCENHVSSILKNRKFILCRQPRFYEHIIRNDRAFYNIQKYIVDNPMKWQEDRFSKK